MTISVEFASENKTITRKTEENCFDFPITKQKGNCGYLQFKDLHSNWVKMLLFVKIVGQRITTLLSHLGRLRPIDPPSIFKVSDSGEKFAASSKTKKSLLSVRNILQDEHPDFEEHGRIYFLQRSCENICFIPLPKLRIGQSCP